MTLNSYSHSFRLLPALLLVIGLTAGCSDLGDPIGPEGNSTLPENPTWVANIWPSVIQTNCSGCHGSSVANGGLNFSEFEEWINEDSSQSNPYVVAGDPSSSELVMRLEGNGVSLMPPTSGLSSSDIQLVKTWIEQGAKKQ